MMTPSILVLTKLQIPPERATRLARERLLTRLRLDDATALTLVTAPAGFGKTTLLSDWAHALLRMEARPGVAWVSLDESDNDASRFVRYVLAGLHQAWGDQVDLRLVEEALTSAPGGGVEGSLVMLVNALLPLKGKTVLFLDDYHLIYAPAVHSAVGFLLERRPVGLHLVIGSRATPPLPLAKLRAKGSLLEIRTADLRFLDRETAALWKIATGTHLDEKQLAALEQRCEGWAAGLQLAMLAVQSGEMSLDALPDALPASDEGTESSFDYLLQEVLQSQPDESQRFLIKTSILDRICAPLAAAMMGEEGEKGSESLRVAAARQMLVRLEESNLFLTPLDREHAWYRYHPLFGGMLRRWLVAHEDPQAPESQVNELHRRAMNWFAKNGMTFEALKHALAAQEYGAATAILWQVSESLLARNELSTLLEWLEKLPEEILNAHPGLLLSASWAKIMLGQGNAATQDLERAESLLADVHLPGREVWFGQSQAIRTFLALSRREPQVVIQHAQDALEFLPHEGYLWRGITTRALGEAYLWLGDLNAAGKAIEEASTLSFSAGNMTLGLASIQHLANLQAARGALRQAEEYYQDGLRRAEQKGWADHPYASLLYTGLASIWMEWNRLDEAESALETALRLAKPGKANELNIHIFSMRMQLGVLQRDFQNARSYLAQVEHILQQAGHGAMPFLGAYRARINLAEGKLRDAVDWAYSSGLDSEGPALGGREYEYMTLAWVWLRSEKPGKLLQALDLLDHLSAWAESSGQGCNRIESLTGLSVGSWLAGDRQRAFSTLEQALDQAGPEGFLRVFLEAGPEMEEICREYGAFPEKPENERRAWYAQKIVEAFSSSPVHSAALKREADRKPTDYPQADALSERELEVLRLMAQGASNQQMADRLVISLATVKSHVNHIMSKLGARNRTEAVARARACGMIE